MLNKLASVFAALFVLMGVYGLNAQYKEHTIFVGTYTQKESKGIYSISIHDDHTFGQPKLAVETDNPSFLAFADNDRELLAVNENGTEKGGGSVSAFKVDKDSLILINKRPSGGNHPCFVAVDESGNVLTANYSSGTVGWLQLAENGRLSPLKSILKHHGKSVSDRQESPHAHSVYFYEEKIISVDLGADKLYFSQIDTVGNILKSMDSLLMPAGSGSRHLAIHPNNQWIYVANELNNSVDFLQKDSIGKFTLKNTTSTLPDSFDKDSYVADIHVSNDGKYLYVSNRGHNSIMVYGIDGDTGYLKPKYVIPTLGEWPRNFALSPDNNYLVVANQQSDNLVLYERNVTSGMLTFKDEVAVPSPVFVLFKK